MNTGAGHNYYGLVREPVWIKLQKQKNKEMETISITGNVVTVCGCMQGSSSHGDWQKVNLIIETKTRKNVCVVCWNETADIVRALKQGSSVTIEAEIESREYNSRWYTDVKAVTVSSEASPKEPSPEPNGGADDLPF